MKYVLDSNISLKWVLTETDSDKARRLRSEFQNQINELLAPDVFPAEVAKAEWRGVVPRYFEAELTPNHDGLESASPDLQSVFKKHGGGLNPFILLPLWRGGRGGLGSGRFAVTGTAAGYERRLRADILRTKKRGEYGQSGSNPESRNHPRH